MTREQELWHLRDDAAIRRAAHISCMNTNKQIDRENDVACRRYNKYRCAHEPSSNDNRGSSSTGPRNIYEEVDLLSEADTRLEYKTETLCPRGVYDDVFAGGDLIILES